MRFYLLLLIALPVVAQPQFDALSVKEFQAELNAEFRDSIKSPLTEKDRKAFQELDFFAADGAYFVNAKFVRTANEKPFEMKTTTSRLPVYVKYGELHFVLQGKTLRLNIYQNTQLIKQEEFKDYLFLPFSDLTNGNESYIGGRFIDLKIPHGDTMALDFNKAYNPYCAYNHKFSCPLVPLENDLEVEIRAGVMKYHD